MTEDRPQYQYIIRDPKTHELKDILTPHVNSCMGGPDTCGGCDNCLLMQAECVGMEVERQPVKDDTAMRDGIFPRALDCDVCGHWEYAPGEMLEPDHNGHHPSCTLYDEPRGAKARLNIMVRANRAHRRLKRRIKQMEEFIALVNAVPSPCKAIGTDCPHLTEVFKALAGQAEDTCLEITRKLDAHPEGYDGPCACGVCRSYGDGVVSDANS